MTHAQAVTLVQRRCVPALLDQQTDLHPVLQRVLSARQINSLHDVDYSLTKLLALDGIQHIHAAAEILGQHLLKQSRILIFGDYDADGATSTALCVKALNLLGHYQVDFYLPDRIADGYGVSESVARRLVELKPDLIITVDTGIASFTGLDLLAEAGIDVIVTDHHLPAEQLPAATVIVNPNAIPGSEGKFLAGVGVAFYLMLALRVYLRSTEWFAQRKEPNLAECLDLVAIGTVADLVPLDYNNRILVDEGLKRIRAGQCSKGLSKLIEFSGRNQKKLCAQDIAFSVAPRINAAGRLDDMSIGVQTLLAEDEISAVALAMELDNINQARRELQGQMTEQAMNMMPDLSDHAELFSIVMYQDDWHEGIVGIIASKLKDISFRPSISFAPAEQGVLKGSCRSIPGIHIRDMLDLVDKQHPGLIIRFGGHAMAAGLTIQQHQFEKFKTSFETVLKQNVSDDVFNNQIEYDGELDANDFNLELAVLLQQSGPWGQRFPVPSFKGDFKVRDQRVLADRHIKFALLPEEGNQSVEAILFYADERELKTNYQNISLHYELAVNEFRGNTHVQLLIRHILPE